ITSAAPPAKPATPPVDRLAGALLGTLPRPLRLRATRGPMVSMVAGLITFGLWPILRWPGRFLNFVKYQRYQFDHLVDWERLHSGEAEPLRGAADRVQFRTSLWLMSLLLAVGTVGWFGYQANANNLPAKQLWEATYCFDAAAPSSWVIPELHGVWIIGLSAAYALHCLQVQLHARDVRRFIRRWNAIATRHGLAPVAAPGAGLGLRV